MIDDRANGESPRVLATNLRRLRIARNLSLSELSRATRLSKATVSGLENANANPTLETIDALARGLDVSLGELLEQPPLPEIRIVRARAAGQGVGRRLARAARWRTLDVLAGAEPTEISELMLAAQARLERPSVGAFARAHVFVLEGRLVIGPAGRPTELEAGDYGSFPLDLPLSCEAGAAGGRALFLTPPSSHPHRGGERA
jgi:transcriptional regulator with XRE-family HTH domain